MEHTFMHNTISTTSPRHSRRAALGSAAALLAGTALALGAPLAAQAHVSASATSTAAGSYTVVTFAVPHGCEGSPTQVVTIDLPESIVSVTPTVNPLWSVETAMVELDEPVESAHGVDPITERVGQVVYTSTTGGLADGLRDTFGLSLQLPAGEAGDVIEFPVTQTCTEGSVVWEGEDVPSVTLTAAVGDAHGDSATDEHANDDPADESTEAASASASADVFARVLGVLGVVVGIIGVILAVLARRSAAASNATKA